MIEDVYNFFAPSDTLKAVPVSVNGDVLTGSRVSLFSGKAPELDEADAKGVKIQYLPLKNWGGEDSRAFRLWGMQKISESEWTKVVITFVPRIAGTVSFSIGIDYGGVREKCDYRDLKFASVAKVECKGAALKEGLLNKPQGLYKSWGQRKNDNKNWEAKTKPQIIKDPNAPGGQYVKTCQSLSQIIKVKKDTEVMISFYIRGGDIFFAQK